MERQVTSSDCAVWVIKAMCLKMQVAVPPAKTIREHIDLDDRGTSILGVRNALIDFGVDAQPVKGPADGISSAPLPAIAMVRIDEAILHYVLVLEANHRTVSYLDPACGGAVRKMRGTEFSEVFTGNLVLCERQADYVRLDFQKEVCARSFAWKALLCEWNSALALALGEAMQLVMLLVGVLMLKNFFGSYVQGAPNFWFLVGMVLCAGIFVWFSKLATAISADIKSRVLLGLLGLSTRLMGEQYRPSGISIRESTSRCIQSATAATSALAAIIKAPSVLTSLILFLAILFSVDVYAGFYAVVVAAVLPCSNSLITKNGRDARRKVSNSRERNQLSLAHVLAGKDSDYESIADVSWGQISYCETLAKHDQWVAAESMSSVAVGRINVFAGLLIGGLQHSTFAMGHAIAVFFLLSIYTSIVCKWAKQVALFPDYMHKVRSLLDFVSDLTSSQLSFKDSLRLETKSDSLIEQGAT